MRNAAQKTKKLRKNLKNFLIFSSKKTNPYILKKPLITEFNLILSDLQWCFRWFITSSLFEFERKKQIN